MTAPLKQERGFVLILSLLCIFLVTAFLASFFVIVSGGVKQATRMTDNMRAYYIADAGLTYGFTQLRNQANPPDETLNYNNDKYYVDADKKRFGSYAVKITNDGATSCRIYTLESRGVFGNATKTLTLTAHTGSMAEWSYLSKSETSPALGKLWWVTGMVTSGKVHTNDQLNIFGNPDFEGPVSQTKTAINYYHGGPPKDNPNFEEGITLGASEIAFPSTTMLSPIQSGASKDPKYSLKGETSIVLNADGTMTVKNSGKTSTLPMPSSKAVYVADGNVNVQGQLNGQLTIGTNSTITITEDITYKSNPRLPGSTSTDTLGLVAKGDVIISKNASPKNNGIEIDAYIVSTDGSFKVENYGTGFKGDMVQFGGLANSVCGPTGVVDSSGNVKAGYNQLQYYDERFKKTAPPLFPPIRSTDGRAVYSRDSFSES